MTNRERVLETLEANSGGLCDECIGTVAGISPHQTVQQICARLAKERLTSRERAPCSRCRKNVLVNKLEETDNQPITTLPDGTQPWFDEMRAALVRIINQLDPTGKGEPFAKRVVGLREKGALPANIASWIRTWTSLRNIVAFDEYRLTNRELEIARLIQKALEAWVPARPSV